MFCQQAKPRAGVAEILSDGEELSVTTRRMSALSSVGRATPLHGEGRGFESLSAHRNLPTMAAGGIVPRLTHMAVKHSPIDMEARRTLDLRAGDTVRVHQKIEEKGKYRIQIFEGLVLARKHGTEPGGTFTVRRVSSGVGVEKIYPLYSPMIDKIEVVKRSRVRRAKLYYIRDKVAREARRQLRRSKVIINVSGVSKIVAKEEAPVAEEVAAEAKAE